MKDLNYYINCFRKLHRNYSFGGAPHKPILLLAVIRANENGIYTGNRITITPELVSLFREIWDQLFTTLHSPNFSFPFFHLSYEKGGYWQLILKRGAVLKLTSSRSIHSFNSLAGSLAYAEIDQELAEMLKLPLDRDALRYVLLETYFKESHSQMSEQRGYNLFEQYKKDILEEDLKEYIARMKEITEDIKKPEAEEEL